MPFPLLIDEVRGLPQYGGSFEARNANLDVLQWLPALPPEDLTPSRLQTAH